MSDTCRRDSRMISSQGFITDNVRFVKVDKSLWRPDVADMQKPRRLIMPRAASS